MSLRIPRFAPATRWQRAIGRVHSAIHKRLHNTGAAAQQLSRLLPSTKDEPLLPRSNVELAGRLTPLADFWNLPGDFISLQDKDNPSEHDSAIDLNKEQITSVLSLPFPDDEAGWKESAPIRNALYTAANVLTTQQFGDKVHYRGLLEFSNICRNDCNYCGIRKSYKLPRFKLDEETILEVARWSDDKRYGSLMLQSGEVVTKQRLDFLCKVIRRIVNETGLGVSLSVGELPDSYYEQLRQAGAKRYLLRIETSNPSHFAKLHPPDQTFDARLDRLRALKRAGFMVGTGVMIGLPGGQTVEDLANDLLFFRREEVDMIGMGPYILQRGTPTADIWIEEHPDMMKALLAKETNSATMGQLDLLDAHAARLFELTTRMIALSRLMLLDANIAATTALQTIHPTGREVALMRGANILMPILTPTSHRAHYQLYEGKVCVEESAKQCRSCLELRVGAAGKRIAYGEHGDPPAYGRRNSDAGPSSHQHLQLVDELMN